MSLRIKDHLQVGHDTYDTLKEYIQQRYTFDDMTADDDPSWRRLPFPYLFGWDDDLERNWRLIEDMYSSKEIDNLLSERLKREKADFGIELRKKNDGNYYRLIPKVGHRKRLLEI